MTGIRIPHSTQHRLVNNYQYGDILPISKFAKILANLEEIVGVL